MREYDVIVIGSGAGSIIVENALRHALSVALVDKGPLGGTCLNLGCIPSKMLIYPADRIVEIREAKKLGIHARIETIDFGLIMDRMRKKVRTSAGHIREGVSRTEALDFYEAQGHFIGDSTLNVNGEKIRGKKIFIAAGARPQIPSDIGLEHVEYLTNESVLDLKDLPKSMIIIGGGYIAAEYGHFFSAMGTEVTVIQRNTMFLPDEEPELSNRLLEAMRKRMVIRTGTEAVDVKATKEGYTVTGKEKQSDRSKEFSAQTILVVTGRQSNADLLEVDKAGVKTDAENFIIVDDYLQTNKKNIWAFGDIIGKEMFRHVANREASVVWQNAIEGERRKMDYHASPHAVFSSPEIASVGMKEHEARARYGAKGILVGTAAYSDVAMGEAMMEQSGFAKAIIDRGKGTIIGFHIVGPSASILIQEVINTMAIGGDIRLLAHGMHIHPALSEVVVSALGNLEKPA